uniref:Enoyl reductase (ER) domain-containing protein n=1 Tax=Leersia perrieri TaxID=77586 RepID=A0A0D9VIQ8_9ORYZ
MGIVETWMREKPIRTFLSQLSTRRAAVGAAAALIASSAAASGDGETGDRSIPQLSPIANSVVSRCSRVLALAIETLQQNFEVDFPDSCKESNTYAKEFLEYCCHKALHEVTARPDYLSDKNLRRLMFDVMLAWETPGAVADDASLENVNDKKTVGLGAFARIAPSCPIIADLVTVHNLFDALTCSSGGRLHFFVFDKYIKSLDKVFRSVKGIMQSPLASSFKLDAGECILAMDGDRPIHPVFQHIGISAWPGRLILTTHALYFQSIKVGYGDKIVKYDLATDADQIIKRDFTGPLGVRLFDKAVMYKSSTLTEPIYFDFPELGGPSRRDYWLAITREVLQVNRFIRKFNLGDIQRAEAHSKAILGILRYSAVKEAFHISPSHFKTTLPFSLAEKLPKGDMVLKALYDNYFQLLDTSLSHLATESPVDNRLQSHSLPFSLYALSRMGFILLKRKDEAQSEISFCAVCSGVTKSLEAALEESICYSERIEAARATIDQVKVEGVDANLALMQELLFPFIHVVKLIYSLTKWDDPLKSFLFLAFTMYVIQRGIVGYILPLSFLVFAVVMLWHKYNGREQLLGVLEDAISKLEETLQAVNIVLLKFRAVLFAAVPKTTEMVAVAFLAAAALLVFLPWRHLFLMAVLEVYTREMPLRKQNTEKFRRRIREWSTYLHSGKELVRESADGMAGASSPAAITCRAAVAWAPGQPLVMEEVEVAPPEAKEIRVKVVSTSICRSDVNQWQSTPLIDYAISETQAQPDLFPRIFGHEASGVVESVGEGVTEFRVGDHVLTVFIGECMSCKHCVSGKSNMCQKLGLERKGVMHSDQKTRFSIRGKPVYHYCAVSSFSEYTVVHSGCAVKVSPSMPMDRICLLSCGVSAGLGAAWNVADISEGSSVVIFGLGTVGLSVAQGAKMRGASIIIGVDTNSEKQEKGKAFGVTDFINPAELNEPVQQVVKRLTNGGADYSFECVGDTGVVSTALQSCSDGWGLTITLGVPKAKPEVSAHYGLLLSGRTLKGSLFGGWRPKSDLPLLVEKYGNKEIQVDGLVTHDMPFSDINKALELMLENKCLRCVVHMPR